MSLILEYCANGNLRGYLQEHSTEFNHNITNTRNDPNNVETKESSRHSLSLLLRWAHQVIVVFFSNHYLS